MVADCGGMSMGMPMPVGIIIEGEGAIAPSARFIGAVDVVLSFFVFFFPSVRERAGGRRRGSKNRRPSSSSS